MIACRGASFASRITGSKQVAAFETHILPEVGSIKRRINRPSVLCLTPIRPLPECFAGADIQ